MDFLDVIENGGLALLDDIGFEDSLISIANRQIENERKKIVNNVISACPPLVEVLNSLKETEQLRIVFSDEVKAKLDSGVFKMMEGKEATGLFKAIVVDQSGKIKAIPDVVIDKGMLGVNPTQLATAMQGVAIQQQLQEITEQLEEISMALSDVLAGQHNDRLAKYYAGASMYKESLSTSNDELRKHLMVSALSLLSDAISELSVSLKYDIDSLCGKYNEKDGSFKKIKSSQVITEMVKINSSFEAIHKAVALKTAIYYKEGEYLACSTALNEYGCFLEKTLTEEKSKILYLADPGAKSFVGVWGERKDILPAKVKTAREQLRNVSEYCIPIMEGDE